METRSSKRLHPYKSKKVKKSGENRQASQSNTLSKDEPTGPSVVSPNTQVYQYGHHEVQVSEGGEADLHKHFVGCQKNPGHTNFIPVKKFTLSHLPDDYQDPDLFDLIKAIADLTVRIGVEMTSPHRSEFFPITNDPFPHYDIRNEKKLRCGTGLLDVLKFTDGIGHELDFNEDAYLSFFDASTKTCPCTKCKHSDKPSNVWWEFLVSSAARVIFDDIEASHTSCRLFYDEQDSPVVSLDKVIVDGVNMEIDRCLLKYATCDPLGEKLYDMAVHTEEVWMKVLNKYNNKSGVNMTFVVSHPHGCNKHVSVGQLMDNSKYGDFDKNYNITKLTYTTSTCPGSSGAKVLLWGQIMDIFMAVL